ncbi:hypothetical protein TVAG_418690 [Trichomonas vaginalis G3]|uniref:Uncharacterized protein n=1 Tax=Trichomonas vaginalis (strain ATCC PRA-98 / G3) TaxID=412133 RepID=A2E7D9_TRIV3|nr:hypothetical protein TVAGG3_0831960 [Trichomonas vaginalis G3]EAY11432.1 hypothetical protein TVAG_418690 [Trichomonas vaginalis G3]KAI5498644.1 hypothetical protein TVAGG3_0831960 [Trichomonas vaginalis G3]|eukprot:XP_001323655.1 hypothetical protein [Trichomonas vaginalis G3]
MFLGEYHLFAYSKQQEKNVLHSDQAPYSVWETFYQDYPKSNYYSGKNVKGSAINGEYFIFNAIFLSVTTTSAITFSKAGIKFLDSYKSLSSCSSNTVGGAINFNCDSSIVQYRSCGYKSQTRGDRGQHSCAMLVWQSNSKNYVYESSFINCGNTEKDDTNYIYLGKPSVKSINSSYCKARYTAGITLYFNTGTFTMTNSSVCNNSATWSVIMSQSSTYTFGFCNVLSNTHTETR